MMMKKKMMMMNAEHMPHTKLPFVSVVHQPQVALSLLTAQ